MDHGDGAPPGRIRTVGLRTMVSLEPCTSPGCGYPNLLATGEFCDLHAHESDDVFTFLALRPIQHEMVQ